MQPSAIKVQPPAKAVPSSPRALEVLTELRQRYDSVAQGRTIGSLEPSDSNFEAATRAASLLPGMTNDFETNPNGFLAHFPKTTVDGNARVTVPAHANGAFELQDFGTGMHVQATLEGAQERPAEMAEGYAIYRQALGPDTSLLRRVMPNGTEDFVSFAQAPDDPSISYKVTLDSSVAGLRNVGNALELLDQGGTPRLRVSPPYIVGNDGTWVESQLNLSDCNSDANPTAPWNRPVTAPGATSCHLRVSWDKDAVEYPALLDPTWTTTNSMSVPRQGHTATLLSTGKVLIVGGTNGTTELSSAELFDLTTGTWATTQSMTGARQMHTAVQLNTSSNGTTSGKVLIAGGRSGTTSLNTAQLYAPTAGTWVAAGNLNVARQQHTATVLTSGKVLVTGGINGTTLLATAATYDPSTGSGNWTATTSPMPTALKFHAATLITTTNTQLNGKVLITGGNNGTASQSLVFLYDPAQLAFSTLASMSTAREGHTATVLSNNKILVAGGKSGTTVLNSASVFDPSTGPGSWLAAGAMTVARQGQTASLLSTGQVLVAGGSNGSAPLSSAETYDGLGVWSTTAAMPDAVQAHTATVLAYGIVLIAGGVKGTTTLSAARLYDVTGGTSCASNSQCQSGNCVSGVCCNTACTDQCYSCNIAGSVGVCSPKPNGSTCSDDNACTQTDTCQSGVCSGGNPVVCAAQDSCHLVGTCDTSTGTCSNPTAPDGTLCTTNNNACKAPDQCASGTCQLGATLPVDDGNPCTTDSCDPVKGIMHTPATSDPWCTALYTAGLKLEVLTNSCDQNQVQQFFQVTNNTSAPINLSDITIKFWVDDTSGADIQPVINTGGCAATSPNYPTCYYQLQSVSAAATGFPGCASDATHRASWEIAVTNTDSGQLQPGEIWTNLQVMLRAGSNFTTFSPGPSQWYSPCLTGTTYASDPHFAVYYKGQLDHTQPVNMPSCRGAGQGPLDFARSPIEINAWKNLVTGEDHPSEVTLTTPVDFAIPFRIWVRSGGNAGTGQLTLEYRNGSGANDVCTYQGAASVAHPTTDIDKALGLEYWLQSCVSGATQDQHVQATWVKVTVVSGDAAATVPVVGVKFALGGGCSDILDPALTPYEIAAMRQSFKWSETLGLEPTDFMGNPAIWHGLIYIERDEQLAWLDQLSIYWKDFPIDATYVGTWNGRCGQMQHSSDGQGKVVFAVFPALFFNIMRTNGADAEAAGVAPLFRFIVPSAPNDPQYVNPDGTLSYQGLADSGYLQWLNARSPASPCHWYDVVCHAGSVYHAVTKIADDTANAVTGGLYGDIIAHVGGVPSPFSTPGDIINYAYTSIGKAWGDVKMVLGGITGFICGTVDVGMNIKVQERDYLLNPNHIPTPFKRMWGPKDSNTYDGRPLDYPVDAHVTLNQWGCGFLPAEHKANISGTGYAGLTALKGSKTIGDGLCIELDTPYAMMTSDIGPDTVCNFSTGNSGSHFSQSWSGDVWVDAAHVYTLTQLHDAKTYAQNEIGYQPHKASLLVGRLANVATGANGTTDSGQPKTLCLSLSGMALDALNTFLPGVSNLMAKDIWWPDAGAYNFSTQDSRGVATHEYGHFVTCSMAFDNGSEPNGADAVSQSILKRLKDGSTDARSDERALMFETMADTFAIQVTGGSNYVHPNSFGSVDQLGFPPTSGKMGFCVGSPCFDYNFDATGDYDSNSSGDHQFNDEVARYESIVFDAFDRADSQNWSSASPGAVSNADVWQKGYGGLNINPASAPFIMNDDEPVSLSATQWRTWIAKWLARSTDPNINAVLGGLMDTIKAAGYTWCDACEVLAPHYTMTKTTPVDARMTNPVGKTRTMQIRAMRWVACGQDSGMSSLLGSSPEVFGNLSSSCTACAPLSHPDDTGTCVPCPAGTVPRGAECKQCYLSSIPGQDNQCHQCAWNQISNGNACVDCPHGQGGDRGSNTCRDCPMDATAVVPCQTSPGCDGNLPVPFTYAATSDDICPTQFWLELTGWSTCYSSEVQVQLELPNSDGAACTNALGHMAAYYPGTPPALGGETATPQHFTYQNAGRSPDGKFFLPDGCYLGGIGTIPAAGAALGTKYWLESDASLNGSPVAGVVRILTPSCTPL